MQIGVVLFGPDFKRMHKKTLGGPILFAGLVWRANTILPAVAQCTILIASEWCTDDSATGQGAPSSCHFFFLCFLTEPPHNQEMWAMQMMLNRNNVWESNLILQQITRTVRIHNSELCQGSVSFRCRKLNWPWNENSLGKSPVGGGGPSLYCMCWR